MVNSTIKPFVFLILGLCSIVTKVSSQQTLYAITGASGTASTLYRLDAATGAVISTVGSTGFKNISALAIHPVTGVLYAMSNPTNGPGYFLKINPANGAGTIISSNVLQVPDMSFSPSGVLYAWAEFDGVSNEDDAFTINLTTGNTTKVGECACYTSRTGFAFNSAGELYLKSIRTIHKMDPATGKFLTTKYLNGTSNNLLAFNSKNEGYTGERIPGGFTLQRIDPATGVVTALGSNALGLISAIVFGKSNPPDVWYLDADGDQFAVSTLEGYTSPGTGYTKTVLPLTDCNDADASLNPLTVWYLDADGDKFAASTVQSCTSPGIKYTRNVMPVTDCDDTKILYADTDGDGFGSGSSSACGVPNNTDNCPSVYNPSQNDFDKNGIGDSCDTKYNVCAAIDTLNRNVKDYMTDGYTPFLIKLEKSLEKTIDDRIPQAINELLSFINQVSTKVNKNGLTEAEAADLIEKARIVITALENGIYSLPCAPPGGISPEFTVPLQAGMVSNSNILVLPNPNKGQFYIQLDKVNATKADVFILDTKGSIIEKKQIQVSAPGEIIPFNLGNIVNGLYIIKVVTDDGIHTAKVLVQK